MDINSKFARLSQIRCGGVHTANSYCSSIRKEQKFKSIYKVKWGNYSTIFLWGSFDIGVHSIEVHEGSVTKLT